MWVGGGVRIPSLGLVTSPHNPSELSAGVLLAGRNLGLVTPLALVHLRKTLVH